MLFNNIGSETLCLNKSNQNMHIPSFYNLTAFFRFVFKFEIIHRKLIFAYGEYACFLGGVFF